MIGVLLATSPYRALCDETIAELAGVKPNIVKTCVDALSSLLYRDEAANRGIRVRHLSIYDFFVSDCCKYQVNIRDADVQLGIACLRVMTMQLCFNICKLEDSWLANADIIDLPSRVKENISDPLQYSCLHWSNHLCFPSDNREQCVLVLGGMRKFFEGLYPLFWVEVLSSMGVVTIGVPSIRRLLSRVRVSTSPTCCSIHSNVIRIGCRMRIQPFLREFRIFVISWLLVIPPSPAALHTFIFQHHHSSPPSHLYRGRSAKDLLGPSRYEWGAYRHGQCHHWSGLDTPSPSRACVICRMGPVLSLGPMTKQFESGMLSPVL